MKRYFITGTDTDCGKTYVTTSFLKIVPKSKAIKPIASGCIEIDGELVSADAKEIQKQCNLSLDQINPWRFKAPISPHIAAKQEGIKVSAKEIANYCANFPADDSEVLFIEGAGGLIVPLNDEETWLDFLKIAEIPVILVVGMKLGCINHALLTETAMKVNNIHCVGWVANCLDPEMKALTQNIDMLKSKLKFPLISVIPHFGEIAESNRCLIQH